MAAPSDRPALRGIPVPEDRHFRPRLVGAHRPRPGRPATLVGYGLLFGALLVLLLAIYSLLPWLLALPASPLASSGALTPAGHLVYGVLAAAFAFGVVAVAALILILLLRKYLAVVQNRYGPVHNGPGGSLQTVADALKLVAKEDFVPGRADALVFTLAPLMVFVSTFLLLAVVPFAPGWVVADLNVGLLFIVAAGTLGAYGVLVAGWSPGNKYGLLGGLRAAAQLVSYEIPLSLALLSVAVWTGGLNLQDITAGQRGVWNVLPLALSAAVYLVASLAEIKMTPFDLPEAESELVAGFHTEYSGMRFGFFFVAEFGELFLLPAIAVVLFFGGYQQPLAGLWDFAGVLSGAGMAGPFLAGLYGMLWFLAKTAVLSWLIMWVRATLPRFRDDQLMELCWKGLIPLSLAGLVVAALLRAVLK